MTQRECMELWPHFYFYMKAGRFVLVLDPESGGYLAFTADRKAECWQKAIDYSERNTRGLI